MLAPGWIRLRLKLKKVAEEIASITLIHDLMNFLNLCVLLRGHPVLPSPYPQHHVLMQYLHRSHF